ncbi:hypothetical protein WICPIJ_004411 [Wickerhamomyces pijperi]|uniref:Uncharacterized protein n=1 Tax=Wickerhamomyces pijperi TaxID=599730 RepID=A0A9P8Q7S9_WICPI|nr:hypothetical protein WICPIJ_004411 [Wickerhamomyces pijperi]
MSTYLNSSLTIESNLRNGETIPSLLKIFLGPSSIVQSFMKPACTQVIFPMKTCNCVQSTTKSAFSFKDEIIHAFLLEIYSGLDTSDTTTYDYHLLRWGWEGHLDISLNELKKQGEEKSTVDSERWFN